ncbi:hypothetical protein MTO96_039651 [Rhipicephalus appendiculatus]
MSHLNQFVQAGAMYVDEEPKDEKERYNTHRFCCRRDSRLQLWKKLSADRRSAPRSSISSPPGKKST